MVRRQAADQEHLVPVRPPDSSSTCDRFSPSHSRSTSTSASFARPSSGGAVTATFSAPACSPEHRLLPRSGWARTASSAPSACGGHGDHAFSSPVEQRRPDPDERRPFLDRDLEVVAHPHRQVRQRQPGPSRAARRAEPRNSANVGRAVSGSSEYAAIVISPPTRHPCERGQLSPSGGHAPPGEAALRLLAAAVHFQQHRHRRAALAAEGVERVEQPRRYRRSESAPRAARCGRSCSAGGGRSGASARRGWRRPSSTTPAAGSRRGRSRRSPAAGPRPGGTRSCVTATSVATPPGRGRPGAAGVSDPRGRRRHAGCRGRRGVRRRSSPHPGGQ